MEKIWKGTTLQETIQGGLLVMPNMSIWQFVLNVGNQGEKGSISLLKVRERQTGGFDKCIKVEDDRVLVKERPLMDQWLILGML